MNSLISWTNVDPRYKLAITFFCPTQKCGTKCCSFLSRTFLGGTKITVFVPLESVQVSVSCTPNVVQPQQSLLINKLFLRFTQVVFSPLKMQMSIYMYLILCVLGEITLLSFYLIIHCDLELSRKLCGSWTSRLPRKHCPHILWTLQLNHGGEFVSLTSHWKNSRSDSW